MVPVGGTLARQTAQFDVQGLLEWLPQETIIFDGALAETAYDVNLGAQAGIIGWDIVCLGRTGSGERFARGDLAQFDPDPPRKQLAVARTRPH